MTPAQTTLPSPAARLRALLARDTILIMPGCHDAMSARLIEAAGFEIGFMSGFAVSADRLGMPDTGLISYAELVDQGQNICRAVSDSADRRRRHRLRQRAEHQAHGPGVRARRLCCDHARGSDRAEAMRSHRGQVGCRP